MIMAATIKNTLNKRPLKMKVWEFYDDLYREGYTIADVNKREISRQFEISYPTVSKWHKEWEAQR